MPGGATPLFMAATNGHLPEAQLLLDRGATVNQTASGGITPLFIAAHHGHVEVVEALLNHVDIRVNEGSIDSGVSPLYIASQENCTVVVETLLKCKGIDVNKAANDSGATPLSVACNLGHEHVVKLLLATDGIDTEHRLRDRSTAHTINAREGNAAIAKMLVDHLEKNQSSPKQDSTWWGGISTRGAGAKKMSNKEVYPEESLDQQSQASSTESPKTSEFRKPRIVKMPTFDRNIESLTQGELDGVGGTGERHHTPSLGEIAEE